MTNERVSSLSDRELLTETRRVAETERQTTAALVSLLVEVDARRLYLGEGYSSLFAFCTRALRLSEPAAYARITAARTARRFPLVLALLGDGAISLTTVGLLAPHLTDENHEAVLDAARHQSKRDVERLVAGLVAQPDIRSSIRALPARHSVPAGPSELSELPPSRSPLDANQRDGAWFASLAQVGLPEQHDVPSHGVPAMPTPPAVSPTVVSPRRSVIAPIAPRRYLVRITVSEETHDKLERARALLRHQIPDGDPAAIVDRALTVLLEQAEHAKFAARVRPARAAATRSAQPGTPRTAIAPSATGATGPRSRGNRSSSRRIPAAVRRAVWARDEGRCAFVGADGRCGEAGFLEFHHVVPFAAGGPSTINNLQLRCRAHNAHEAERDYGDWRLRASTPSGRS
jgi:hypothetical protein